MINRLNAPTVLVLCAMLLGTPGHSQQVPVTSLSLPDRTFQRGFTKLVGVKELSDGRVILADQIERLILLLDSEMEDAEPIGSLGAGPGQYQVPLRLLSLNGDSSAVLDTPNLRLLVLGPDGEPSGFLDFVRGLGNLTASDDLGRLYSSGRVGDSRAIVRWSPPSRVFDTIAFYPANRDPRVAVVGGVITANPQDVRPFMPQPTWAVAATGRIAIVHPEPYRVEMVSTEGVAREGTIIPVHPVSVTEEHKQQWREERMRSAKPLGVQQDSTSRSLSLEPAHWPEHLPPFLSDGATFAHDGRLWVQRATPVGQPSTFDVFDPEGRRIEQMTLPSGRRLIGFGKGTVYAVVRDGIGLDYLERYSLGGAG